MPSHEFSFFGDSVAVGTRAFKGCVKEADSPVGRRSLLSPTRNATPKNDDRRSRHARAAAVVCPLLALTPLGRQNPHHTHSRITPDVKPDAPADHRFARATCAGFSLVEMMIVVAVIVIVAAFAWPNLKSRDRRGDLLRQNTEALQGRRKEARLLAPLNAKTAQENYTQPPLIIDFKQPATTAPLRIEGTDNNGDFMDDDRPGISLTRFNAAAGQWRYAYEGAPLALPTGWRLLPDGAGLPAGVGLIKDSAGGVLGRPVSAVGFDANGDAWGDQDGNGTAESSPRSLTGAAGSESPFWAVYFTDGETACAVAVHATGYIESWVNTPEGWRGRKSRTPGN